MNIQVRIKEDECGNITARPVRQDIEARIKNHLAEFGVHSDGRAFFQEGMGAQEFKEQLSRFCQRELEWGNSVTLNFDTWEVGHWYGWGTHTLFE